MIFVPIIAGWALGVTSAKLVDTQRSGALLTEAAKRRVRVVQNIEPPPSPKEQVTALVKEVDDRYQRVIHNTVDRMFGEH